MRSGRGEHCGEHHDTKDLTFTLRERAVDSLQAYTMMLDVAVKLVKQGNLKEARRLRDEARAKRNESMRLVAQVHAQAAQ
jgi:hypothetical protein